MTREHHLRCTACKYLPTVAQIGGNEHLVCHCTHVDGEIDPVQLHGFDTMPDRWEWVPQVDEPNRATAQR